MEGLRHGARSAFLTQQCFITSTAVFDVVEIYQNGLHNAVHCQAEVPKEELLQRTKPATEAYGDSASFILTTINKTHRGHLQISNPFFTDLFDTFRIEPYILHLFGHSKRGFHHFRAYTDADSQNYVDSFYVHCTLATLLWSFDNSTKTTRAILVANHSSLMPHPINVPEHFWIQLELHKDLAFTPSFLKLVFSVVTGSWIDLGLSYAVLQLRRTDMHTKHGVWASSKSTLPTLDDLLHVSQTVGSLRTALGYTSRHADLILDLLVESDDPAPHDRICVVAKSDESAEAKLNMARQVLVNQTRMRKSDIEYMHKRADDQSTIIFSLINHETASATKADSAAMKMLALMTTIFLPGTFFATMFAIPTLHWSESKVISNRFWIYWAFVLPSTAFLVFVYKGWIWMPSRFNWQDVLGHIVKGNKRDRDKV